MNYLTREEMLNAQGRRTDDVKILAGMVKIAEPSPLVLTRLAKLNASTDDPLAALRALCVDCIVDDKQNPIFTDESDVPRFLARIGPEDSAQLEEAIVKLVPEKFRRKKPETAAPAAEPEEAAPPPNP